MTRTFRTLTYDRVSHTKLDRERRMISARLTDSSSLCRDHAHDTLHRPAATATASRTPRLRTGSVSTWKQSWTPLALRAVLPTCAHLRAAVRPTNADDATAQRNDATQRRNAPAQPRCNARHHSANGPLGRATFRGAGACLKGHPACVDRCQRASSTGAAIRDRSQRPHAGRHSTSASRSDTTSRYLPRAVRSIDGT